MNVKNKMVLAALIGLVISYAILMKFQNYWILFKKMVLEFGKEY